MIDPLISNKDALHQLKTLKKESLALLTHKLFTLEVYKPDKVDLQQPHKNDEAYIIISGSGKFYMDGKAIDIKVGDFLFVQAGTVHRFMEFTEDFSTWVIFFSSDKDGYLL